MRAFWFVILAVAVAIAATMVPLYRTGFELAIFVGLFVVTVLLVRLRIAFVPSWFPALTMSLAGIGHIVAMLWMGRVAAHPPNLAGLRTFAVAYLVVAVYLWLTGRLRWRPRT